MKKALITGISGQDGSYLAELLLKKEYEVHGLVRRRPETCSNLAAVAGHPRLHLHYGDLTDSLSLQAALARAQPDEIYNLAAQVFIPTSWREPAATFDVNVGGLARLLKAVEETFPAARVYQASSSEMFGNQNGALSETSPLLPVSPYGAAKVAAHLLARVYREKDLYVACGILFNHESPRRGSEMVTRKIASHVARWAKGHRQNLTLGSLTSRRDWGYAADYVEAMHRMLQLDKPEDFVIGTGETHSVEDFLRAAVAAADLPEDVLGLVRANDPGMIRPNELKCLVADATKAGALLNWRPKVRFAELARLMVQAEVSR